MKPESKKRRTRAVVRQHTHRHHWIDASLSLHPYVEGCHLAAQQAPVVDLTVKLRTNPPMEFVVPLTRENLEAAGKVAFWTMGAIGLIEFISTISGQKTR